MAGIGFQLERLGRDGGIGGAASAAIHGAVVSSGPWLLTIVGVVSLQFWTIAHLPANDGAAVQAIMIFAFAASIIIAAPVSTMFVRIAADRLFAGDRESLPGILAEALTWATVPTLLGAMLLFGGWGALAPLPAFLATIVTALLCQISVVAPFLTATRRHQPILAAYVAGIAVAAALIRLFQFATVDSVLLAVATGLAVTLATLIATMNRDFPVFAAPMHKWSAEIRGVAHLGLAGLASSLALWVDKWILWNAHGSQAALGALRLNPINDEASFLGLLTIIPGLTLMLIISETRFERTFSRLMIRCNGTSKLDRIESGRRAVGRAILCDLRLLALVQSALALICWVLAPEIFRLLGLDARGIFAFRFTAVGVVFHILTIYSTVVLSYYDLFGRILVIWTTFVAVSAMATLGSTGHGFASFGWGYLAGGVAAVSVGLALLSDATARLNYFLFVANNPAVVGKTRYWV